MVNEQEITFDEPDEGRDIYHEPDDRALIRTKDVYQTELDNGVEGYSETMLAIVANFKNAMLKGLYTPRILRLKW